MKIVINRCYGGFGLSQKAYEKLIEYGVPGRPYVEQERGADGLYKPQPANDGEVIFTSGMKHEKYWEIWIRQDNSRTDPRIIRVVEELGEAANGPHAKLAIVEIPDGVQWEIDEYDGIESIHETHRSWI